MIQFKKLYQCCGKVMSIFVCSGPIRIKNLLFFFLVLVGFISIPHPSMAEVVGAIMPSNDIPHYMAMHDGMLNELKNSRADVKVILQMPAASHPSWRNSVKKLETLGSNVIVTYGSAVTVFVTEMKLQTQIVYGGVYPPSSSNIKGKVTGMEADFPLVELLASLKKISKYSKLAILYSSMENASILQMEAAKAIVSKTGEEVVTIDTYDVNFLDQAGDDAVFDTDFFNLSGADAVLLTSASSINSRENMRKIAEHSLENRIPTASVFSGTCEMGILLSYAVDPLHQGKGVAMKLIETLEGVNPADIPPGKSTDIEKTLNLSTARQLGLSVPFELLGAAKIVK